MNIPNETYNSGWIHLDLGSTPVLAHSGNTYTAQANMEIIPGSRWAVILLMGDSSLFWLARQDSIGVNVARMLAGLPPVRGIPPTDTYIILLVLLVILLVTAVISVRRAARWLRDPALRPVKAGAVLGQLVLPLVVFLGYAYLVLVNLMGDGFRRLNPSRGDLRPPRSRLDGRHQRRVGAGAGCRVDWADGAVILAS